MPTNSKEYMKEYYHKNRENFLCKYSGTHYCTACDVTFQSSYLNRHNKTEKHKLNVMMYNNGNKNTNKNTNNDKETFKKIKLLRLEIEMKLKEVQQLEATVGIKYLNIE